jgi:hypothetical protein
LYTKSRPSSAYRKLWNRVPMLLGLPASDMHSTVSLVIDRIMAVRSSLHGMSGRSPVREYDPPVTLIELASTTARRCGPPPRGD